MRTLIQVPKEELNYLDQIGKAQKRSRASVIREAIREYLSKQPSPAREGAFGLWKDRNKDGLDYQRELRDEWGS